MTETKHNSFFDSDKSLLLRLKKYRDKEAFLTAYDNYADDIYRFLLFKVGDAEEARDLTSATFVKAWSVVNEGRLKDDDNYRTIKAFLYRIARNQAIDYYRQKKSVALSDLPENWSEPTDESNAMATLNNRLDGQLLMGELAKLKAEYRNVLIMYYVNSLSIAEIAKVLDKNKGAVRVLIFRAAKALKDSLAAKGL